jgi:uncharacterized protein (TIGR03086 family)
MDELLALYRTAVDEFTARVDAIEPGQWDAPTPCRDWTVADLVRHLIDEQRWVPPLIHGHDLETARRIVEGEAAGRAAGEGIDLKLEWHEVATAALQAFGEPGALDGTVSLLRGPTPARQFLGEMIADLVVHGWDLGRAIGYPGQLPEQTVAFVWSSIEQFGDLSSTGMFAAPVNVPADAPLVDRLVAATGRNPAG